MLGSNNLPAAPLRYWEDLLLKSVQHEDWQTYRLANYWDDRVTRSRETQQYLAREYEAAKRILTDLGLATAPKQ
jgi:tripartite-type tricarboxylate transporter receptor subunit TctC